MGLKKRESTGPGPSVLRTNSFLTALTMDFLRFEAQFCCSARVLRRESILASLFRQNKDNNRIISAFLVAPVLRVVASVFPVASAAEHLFSLKDTHGKTSTPCHPSSRGLGKGSCK